MRPHREPLLSPQGTCRERKLVEAWKPTFIISRLLGQQLTTNVSGEHVRLLWNPRACKEWNKAVSALAPCCPPCLSVNVRLEKCATLHGVYSRYLTFHEGPGYPEASSYLCKHLITYWTRSWPEPSHTEFHTAKSLWRGHSNLLFIGWFVRLLQTK